MSNRDHYREHRIPTTRWPASAPSPGSDKLAMARELWRDHGVILIWPDQQIPWDQRAMAEKAARKLYGDKVR